MSTTSKTSNIEYFRELFSLIITVDNSKENLNFAELLLLIFELLY